MVVPLILGGFFVVDMAVYLVTGKDILEHTTGWDPVGDAVDWVFDTFAGGSEETNMASGWEQVIANMDEWGLSLTGQIDGVYQLLYVILAVVVIIGILIIWTRPRSAK